MLGVAVETIPATRVLVVHPWPRTAEPGGVDSAADS